MVRDDVAHRATWKTKETLGVKIKTMLDDALIPPVGHPDARCWDSNYLGSIEVTYLHATAGNGKAISHDLAEICTFSELHHLAIIGGELYQNRSLELKNLGTPDCMPQWPRMKSVRLENIQIDPLTAARLKSLSSVNLDFRNCY